MQANDDALTALRGQYQLQMLEIRGAFESGRAPGSTTIRARAAAMDALVQSLWSEALAADARLGAGIALLAVGGYGRQELFPYSDVDLLFVLEAKVAESSVKDAIRRISQNLWDSGIRVSPQTRRLAECERFDPQVPEFALSLLDHRLLAGDAALSSTLRGKSLPALVQREKKVIVSRLMEITEARHARYGHTLFHLEPNIKDAPGGLRDVHVCSWLQVLAGQQGILQAAGAVEDEFRLAVEFLNRLRCFLHFRHERDDNILDWQAQDAAAAGAVGLIQQGSFRHSADAAYWMRLYFRHARSVQRRFAHVAESIPSSGRASRRLWPAKLFGGKGQAGGKSRREPGARSAGMAASDTLRTSALDPAAVLLAFAEMAASGGRLAQTTEAQVALALPALSSHLEEGAILWHTLRRILIGRHAGTALRSMHALGILELLIPEFHGIDALVIRDAYHRYTVDEHTFVAIDTLHELEQQDVPGASPWTAKFAAILREMPHPDLLYLGALLHDTGKGRNTGDHAGESVRLAEGVLARLELDAYETGLVTSLIRNHLEMSAALRRDIFDAETVRAFAGKVATPEALRMLTLFTYADIKAVHPDALTPWKAENIWRLYIATSNFLDRNVDGERVNPLADNELVDRVSALLAGRRREVVACLDGFPERYLRTRTPEQVVQHIEMMTHLDEDPVQLHFRHTPEVCEITLVTLDRPRLFATLAGALAAWGMNIVTADAFSNRRGIVVDTARFTDAFRTLELNAEEHAVFLKSVRDVIQGTVSLEKLLSGRRRARPKAPKVVVEQRIEFDDEASSQSTLLQVVAQDVPGLLRSISLTLSAGGHNIEVALVDTEGEMAIDVFYITRNGAKLDPREQKELHGALQQAIATNAV